MLLNSDLAIIEFLSIQFFVLSFNSNLAFVISIFDGLKKEESADNYHL